jgi:S1-C subfamily serine protease
MACMTDMLASLSASLSALAARAAPGLVSVATPRGRASGFVWRPGLVVTPEEALGEAEAITVTAQGGAALPSRLLGRDASTDVALLSVEGLGAPATALHGEPPAMGALALAIGAENAALGIISHASGPWRSMRGGEIAARIELDLSLRRPAEGALVFDAEGRAFGMAVFGPRRRVLVIPAATIERAAEALMRDGRVARGWLGVALHPVALPGGGHGIMLMAVDPASPAAAAGLMQGDVLTHWDGAALGEARRIAKALGPDSVGRSVTLGFRRGGEPREAVVTIAARPA